MSDAKPAPPLVTALGNGAFRVEVSGSQRIAYGVRTSAGAWVFLDGEVFVLEAERRSTRARGAADELGSLSAPMPATIVAIEVTVGQQVAAGDVLLRLEAMKMELPVRAPRAATVVAVKCREGELVQPGVPLIELD